MKENLAYFFYTLKPDNNSKILKNIATKIRRDKNLISKILHKDRDLLLLVYQNEISKDAFVLLVYNKVKNKVIHKDSVTLQQSLRQIYICYQNMFDQIMRYKSKEELGDLELSARRFLLRHSKSSILKTLKHLESLLKNIKSSNAYQDVIEYCIKNIERLLPIIKEVKLKIIEKSRIIRFKELTFSSRNVLTYPKITFIENDSKFVTISINIPNYKSLDFMVKYNKNYHGDLKEFVHSIRKKNSKPIQNTINYSVKFLSSGRLKFIFTKEVELPNLNFSKEDLPIIGGDANTKHNILQLSDGKSFRINKTILRKEIHLRHQLQKRDKNMKLNKNKNKKHSKRLRLLEEKQIRRRNESLKEICSQIRKYCEQRGYTSLALEDLNLITRAKNKSKVFNQKHIESAFHINDLKNILYQQFKNRGLNIHLVNPKYTSQTCPKCGSTCKENRKIQEIFQCKECGFTENADLVSSINILLRILIPELRNELEYFDKKEKRYKGKDIWNKYIYEKFVKSVLPNYTNLWS